MTQRDLTPKKNSWHHLIVEWTWRVPTIANSLFVEAGIHVFAEMICLSCSSCIKSSFRLATKLITPQTTKSVAEVASNLNHTLRAMGDSIKQLFSWIMTPKRFARPRGVIKLVNRRKKPEWKAENREIENVNTGDRLRGISWNVFTFRVLFHRDRKQGQRCKKKFWLLDTTKGVNWVRWSLNISSSFLLSDWLGQYCHFG